MRNLVIVAVVVVLVAVGAVVVVNNHSSKSSTQTSAATSSAGKSASQSNEPTVNNAVLITKHDNSAGNYLADPNGNALYTYKKDAQGVSNCTGGCLTEWP